MSGKIVQQLAGSAHFDHNTQHKVSESINDALEQLAAAAHAANGEIVWSSLTLSFDVNTIEEQILTRTHPRILPGRSTVTAYAETILANGEPSE